jgi:nitroreductase
VKLVENSSKPSVTHSPTGNQQQEGRRCMSALDQTPIAPSEIGLAEGLVSTRALRRYTDDPVPEQVLRDLLFAATRAPSGSNRQPFRFLVLRDGERAREAKRLIAVAAREMWAAKTVNDGWAQGSGAVADTPKARMAATMQHYVDTFETVPVLVLPCLNRYREPEYTEGSNIYPACQNLLLAARAYGYGGVMTMFHKAVEPQLRELLSIPEGTALCATITLGKPTGSHGPVRRRPLPELVYEDAWGEPATWALDPPGTAFTSAGPPKPATVSGE